MEPALRATVITVSDEVASGRDENRAGPVAVAELEIQGLQAELVVVGDDRDAIRAAVTAAIGSGSRVVITTGGTGIGPADITPEAVTPLLSYQLPGLAEEIRRRGAERISAALMSRGVAGVILGSPSTFVLTAPGSRGGVRDALGVAGPLLEQIIAQLDGGNRP